MGRLALVVVALLVFVVGGSVGAAADTDLRSLLADAPGSDWHEASGGDPYALEGSFTAASYGQFEGQSSTGPTANALNDYGFNAGYGREWQQFASRDYLVERVFQFDNVAGAKSWYDDIKKNSESNSQGTIAAASAIPNSFGVVVKDPKYPPLWVVDFLKDNRVFMVHTESSTSDLSSLAVSQAQKEYNGNPNRRSGPGGQTPAWLLPVAYGIAGALFIFLIGVVVVAAVVIRRGRGPTPAFAPAGGTGPLQMSPDGAFWWDGARWRDSRVEIPPNARRSPDGAYWWDGRTWRRPGF